jgi:hypothetical protein
VTPAQRAKLALAGRGDIKHLLDRAENLRRAFAADAGDREGFRACLHQATLLQQAMAAPICQDGSLLAKTMKRVITPGQFALAAARRRQRETRIHQDAISATVSTLARALSLSADQRGRFKQLLLEETRPPARSGDSHVAFVMFQTSRLSRAKLHPIFDDDQWRMLQRFLSAYEHVDEFLKDDGFVFGDIPRAPPSESSPFRTLSRRLKD